MTTTRDLQKQAYEAYTRLNNFTHVAEELGIPRKTASARVKAYQKMIGEAPAIDDPNFLAHCKARGIDPDLVIEYWDKTDEYSIRVRPEGAVSLDDRVEKLIAKMDAHSPDYSYIAPVFDTDGHLLVIDPADVHIGKLATVSETGNKYNMEIAQTRLVEGSLELYYRAKPFGIDTVVFVIGNDILHVDNAFHKTTSGTNQDTDGQIWDMYNAALAAYIAVIEEISRYSKVHIIDCRSNHDFLMGWSLASNLKSWFRTNPNVSASIRPMHRKYLEFGKNLIGFTHGDGAKEFKLPQIMQAEAREAWGRTKFAYWYTHHLHHKIRNKYSVNATLQTEHDDTAVTVIRSGGSVEPGSVYVETIRSPSPSDGWHHRNGYINRPAVEAFIHHPEYGQVARFTQFF